MGVVYTRNPGSADAHNPQRELELLAAAEQAGWPPAYIQPEQKSAVPWSDGPALNVRLAGEDGWRTFVQLAGAAQLLAAQRLLLCILIGMADTFMGEPDGPLIGPANDWGERFEKLGHEEPVEQHPEPPYLVNTVGVAYGWEKASAAVRELVLKHWPNARINDLRFEPDENEGIVVSAANSRGLLHFFASEIERVQLRINAAEQGIQARPHGHQRVTGGPYEHAHVDGGRIHGHLADDLPKTNAEERQRERERAADAALKGTLPPGISTDAGQAQVEQALHLPPDWRDAYEAPVEQARDAEIERLKAEWAEKQASTRRKESGTDATA
jgi:hypothetical protein